MAVACPAFADDPLGPPALGVQIEEIALDTPRLAVGTFDGTTWSADGGVALAGAHKSGFYTSPVLGPNAPFTHVGLRWTADEADALSFVVRTSKDGKSWSSWTDVRPDPHRRVGTKESFGALVPADRATYVQFRVAFDASVGDGHLRTATITLLNAKDGLSIPTAPGTLTTPSVTTGAFLRREQWAADESIRFVDGAETWARMYVPVKKVVVHHTDTTNNYNTPEEAKAEVRAIYAYHTIALGWGDIGYNALIDKWGNVYEGRHGRGDGPSREVMSPGVVAGHAYFHNYGSAGIALLGTFTGPGEDSDEPGIRPSEAMKAALVDTLAWECNRHNVDPRESSDYLLSTNEWNKGLANLSGHRDCVATLCPGGNVYELLPSIRTAVAAKIARPSPKLALAADTGTRATPVTLQRAQFSWGGVGETGKFLYLLEGWRPDATGSENLEYLSGFDGRAKPSWKPTELKAAAWSQLLSSFTPDASKLTSGHFTFHVMALDDSGRPSYQRDHTLLLTSGADLPPSVTITSPADGARFATGTPISFEASATDPEDGNLTDRMNWVSSKDGAIGRVAIFSKTLSAGDHTITASVNDSNGVTVSSSVSIRVG